MAPIGTNPSSAAADADPASDVLLAQNVYYPYQLHTDPPLEAAMNRVLSSAARAGLPLKVAVIGSSLDLGAIPNFFGHPQQYAQFLDKEISFNDRPSLLVVMPAGFGVVAAGPSNALASLKVNTHQSAYGLVRTAVLAVVMLARSTGRTIATPLIPTSASPGSGTPTILLFAVPVALLGLGGVVLLRRRERSSHKQSPDSSDRASVAEVLAPQQLGRSTRPALSVSSRSSRERRATAGPSRAVARRRRVVTVIVAFAVAAGLGLAIDDVAAQRSHKPTKSSSSAIRRSSPGRPATRTTARGGGVPTTVTSELETNLRVLGYTSYIALGTPRKREVALTFDDGPSPYTPHVLSILERFHVKATFFEIGRNVRVYPRFTARLARAGMVIGDHTEEHPPMSLLGARRTSVRTGRGCERHTRRRRSATAPVPTSLRLLRRHHTAPTARTEHAHGAVVSRYERLHAPRCAADHPHGAERRAPRCRHPLSRRWR